MNHHLRIVRLLGGKNSTLSHLYLNGIFLCYLLEDRVAAVKSAGFTCIPEGDYSLKRNTYSGMNRNYQRRFPDMHRGMLQICGIPGFDLVFLHIGNTHQDTRGCPLTGMYWQKQGEDYEVYQSEMAYKSCYPLLNRLLAEGALDLSVENQTEGKWNSLF